MSNTLRKVLIIFGVIILLVVLTLGGALIYLNRNADAIAADFLKKEYEGSELSQVYDISYGDISVGLISGSFKISQLNVSPKESFFTSHDSLRLKYSTLFRVHIPSLKITGLDENFSLSLSEINLERILVSSPSITLIDHLTAAEKEIAASIKRSQKQKAKEGEGKIQQFNLRNFEIRNGSFSYFDRKKQAEVVAAGSINVAYEDVSIAFAGEMETLVSRTVKDSRISVGKIKYPVPNGFYVIEVGEIVNLSGSHDFSIIDFELIPQYDKMDFGKVFGKQTDRMQISLREIAVKGFDFEKFLNEDQIFIDHILVDGLYLNAFRDKNIPFDYTRFPKMPQQSLAELKTPLDIREIKITNSEVLYEQLGVEGIEPGQVPIKAINGSIRNVSNIAAQIEKHGPMVWEIDANFFAEGQLHLMVEFTEDLSQPDFSFSGSMQQMDMKNFNQMIEHTEYIRIDSGMIQSMTFEAVANSEFVDGELLMEYENLKIAGLRRVSKKEKDELGFFSAIANVVIRQFNPAKKHEGEPMVSEIFYERDKNKGIFNYLSKGLISGIKSTILPSISSPRKHYEKKIEKEEKKSAREQRKEERQKRREEKKEGKSK
jgi:hypothetical protein